MFNNSHYTVGWVCALRTELVAATQYLDEKHDSSDYEAAPNDNNIYVFGNIGKHNIVIATLPRGEYGISSASMVARDMVRSFTNVRICFMVGIGGGAPLMEPDEQPKRDIRLGDVVVSIPSNARGGVIQYDYGKTIQDQDFKLTGHLNSPPQFILTAVGVLGAEFEAEENGLDKDVRICLDKNKKIQKKYQRPDQTTDRLYRSSYIHKNDNENCSKSCNEAEQVTWRDPRNEDEDSVAIHEGLIASANQLMKDAFMRDRLARNSGVLCFEMEAAGLMNQFPTLVVRGICDYSDTHKNKEWQGYAAMTAAAYAKRLLLKLPPAKVAVEARLSELREIKDQLQQCK